MSTASLSGALDRSPRMSQSPLPRFRVLLFGRRRRRAWYRAVARRYWRLSAERDELRRTVDHLQAELDDLTQMHAVLHSDLSRQRAQHTADLALLGQRSRALRDVTKICETGRAAGVTAVSIDKVAAAAERGTW